MIEATKGRSGEGGGEDRQDTATAAPPRGSWWPGEAGVVCLRIRNESNAPTPRVTALTARRVVDLSIVSVGTASERNLRGRERARRRQTSLFTLVPTDELKSIVISLRSELGSERKSTEGRGEPADSRTEEEGRWNGVTRLLSIASGRGRGSITAKFASTSQLRSGPPAAPNSARFSHRLCNYAPRFWTSSKPE